MALQHVPAGRMQVMFRSCPLEVSRSFLGQMRQRVVQHSLTMDWGNPGREWRFHGLQLVFVAS